MNLCRSVSASCDCASVRLCVRDCTCARVCLRVCECPSACDCGSASVCMWSFIYTIWYVCACLSTCLCICACASAHLFVVLSVCLCITVSVCVRACVWLPACLPALAMEKSNRNTLLVANAFQTIVSKARAYINSDRLPCWIGMMSGRGRTTFIFNLMPHPGQQKERRGNGP